MKKIKGFSLGSEFGSVEPTFQVKGKKEKLGINEMPKIETTIDLPTLNEDIEELTNGFAERAKAEEERFKAVTSLDYYFAVYFNNPVQKWEVLKKLGLADICDGDQYINGYELILALNKVLKPEFQIEVPTTIVPIPKPFSMSKRVKAMKESKVI